MKPNTAAARPGSGSASAQYAVHPQFFQKLTYAHHVDRSFQVIGEHGKRHFTFDLGQSTHAEAAPEHPLQIAEGMLCSGGAQAHQPRMSARALMSPFGRLGKPRARNSAPSA